jgi:hypothetical protein
MMHFSCDLCGKVILPGDDQRYVVRIEAYAAQDAPLITDADLEDDHMEEVSQLLRDMEDNLVGDDADEAARAFRFDLCPECHQRFVRDPLGKEHGHKLYFSKN